MTENNNLIDKQKSVHNAAWAACDAFRGILDATEYKNYILSFLFSHYSSHPNKPKETKCTARLHAVLQSDCS